MKPFRDPDETIGSLDATTAATLVATSADVALVLDHEGIIQDMAVQPSDLSLELESFGRWLGRPWTDTVSAESQRKVESLLQEAGERSASNWRQLTHQSVAGRDVPILYSAVRLGEDGRVVALGRDLRAVAALQQRLVDAQMAMERDYAKARFAETRYRLLFQTSPEAVLIVDGATQKVVEGNPAADALFEKRGRKGAAGKPAAARNLVGRSLADLFAPEGRARIAAVLAEARPSRADDITIALEDGTAVTVQLAPYRQEGAAMALLRLTVATGTATGAIAADGAFPSATPLGAFVRASPDAIVLTDSAGHVVEANDAFATIVEAADAAALVGRPLDQWLGRPGVDLDVMLSNLRQHGLLRLFSTVLRAEGGEQTEVEVSGAAVGSGRDGVYGFSIRDVGRRLAPATRANELPRSADQLAEMIGRVPLKDIVRETTDVIERLCIESALQITNDNRAAASELLGLSRQSLYVKLRRYGLVEAGAEDEPA